MQIELPPVKMIDIEREVIIFSVVAGVGQNIPATFGKAQKNVSKTKQHFNQSHCRFQLTVKALKCIAVAKKLRCTGISAYPALRNSSLTMFFKGTQIRRGNFLNRRWGNCPNSCGTRRS